MTKVSNTLRLAPGLSLDADAVAGGSLALLGQRGAGKTFACRVLAEELVDAHVQTVVIDPMGVFWGLRSSADGEHEGLPIPVFGGSHADAPLEPSAGALMADLVVDEGLSMILDLSLFTSRSQERTFAAAFLDRLYRRNRDLVHLIVDEADLFAPQKPRGPDAALLVTMENIVRRGRNKGIGVTMASQRPAVLSKDVLTQVQMLAVLRMTGPQDRAAIREWVRGQGDEETWSKIAPSLPGLGNGESWWWVPEQHILKKVQVRRARTFDSSPTRTRKAGGRTPKTFADVDLAAISSRIEATIERAKETDPRELHRRIVTLEKDLRTTRAALTVAEARPTSTVAPAPVLDPDLVARLETLSRDLVAPVIAAAKARAALVDRLVEITEEVAATGGDAEERVLELGGQVGALISQLTPSEAPTVATALPAPRRARLPRPAPVPAPRAAPTEILDAPPGPGPSAYAAEPVAPARQRLLDALASMEGIGVAQVARTQLALWAGTSPKSSGYANNLGGLRTQGLIDYPSPGTVGLTEAGRALTTPDAGAGLRTTAELHEHVRSLLSPARWRLVEPLLAVYPSALGRENLAEAAGSSPTSSGFANNLGALRSLGLIDYPSPGHVVATDVLFLGE